MCLLCSFCIMHISLIPMGALCFRTLFLTSWRGCMEEGFERLWNDVFSLVPVSLLHLYFCMITLSTHWISPISVSAIATQAELTPDGGAECRGFPVRVEFTENSLTYMEKLLLKKNRRYTHTHTTACITTRGFHAFLTLYKQTRNLLKLHSMQQQQNCPYRMTKISNQEHD